jgi:hypothetical protein
MPTRNHKRFLDASLMRTFCLTDSCDSQSPWTDTKRIEWMVLYLVCCKGYAALSGEYFW